MKSKKLISLLCAAALTASSFAAFAVTASAAEIGDKLAENNFENVTGDAVTGGYANKYIMVNETPTATTAPLYATLAQSGTAYKYTDTWKNSWGGGIAQEKESSTFIQGLGFYGNAADAAAYFENIIGTQKVTQNGTDTIWDTYNAPTVTAPDVVGTKSLYFATQNGMAKTISFTINPATTASTTGVFDVKYDMMLVNAEYREGGTADSFTYDLFLGDSKNIIKFTVKAGDLYYYNGSTMTDTGIDLTKDGTWFNFDFKVDTNSTKYRGTIKAYDGNTLSSTAAAEIPWSDFNDKTAKAITKLSATSYKGVSTADGRDKGAVNCAIDNFTITEADTVATKKITLNFKSGETVLKDSVDVEVETGTDFVLGADYKVSLATTDSRTAHKYYKYASATPAETISDVQASQSVTLNFTEEDMPKTTINAVCGTTVLDEIVSDYVVPGEKVTGYAHEYMKGTDNKWYQKVEVAGARSLPSYDVSATGGEDAVVVNVNYVPAYDVVSFKEAENDEGTTHGTDSTTYPKSLFSGGEWVQSASNGTYPKGFVTDAVEAAGTYSVTVHHYSNANRPFAVGTLSRADRDTKYAEKFGESTANGMYTETFTATLEEGNCFYIGKNGDGMGTTAASDTKAIADIDYIVVKDTSLDAAPVPEVTIGNISGYDETVQLTLTNSDEFLPLGINPKVTLIQAVYDGKTLSDVKVWNNIEISSQTGGVTEEISDAIFDEDSVFYVWDAVGGVRPLGAAKPYTAERI